MKCWTVIYNHKHGTDSWPLFQDERPTVDEVKEQIKDETGEFDEEDEREWLEIVGPYDVPYSARYEERIKELEERLQIDPGGSDKIDELEQAMEFLRHRAERAEELAESSVAVTHKLQDEREAYLERAKRAIQGALSTDSTHRQLHELVRASEDVRNWLVDEWPKVLKIVDALDKAGLSEEFKDVRIVDPAGRLVELARALAKCHDASFKPVHTQLEIPGIREMNRPKGIPWGKST